MYNGVGKCCCGQQELDLLPAQEGLESQLNQQTGLKKKTKNKKMGGCFDLKWEII